EPAPRVGEVHPLEVVLGQADEPAALPPRHGGPGPVVPARLAALHLDDFFFKQKTAYEIDLTVPQLDIARDDAQPGALEQLRRGLFGRAPQDVARIAHGRDRDPPPRG